MSMARRTFPSRLELNRPEASFNAAPLASVIFTTFLYVSPVQKMSDDAAMGPHGSPDPLPLFDDLRVCRECPFFASGATIKSDVNIFLRPGGSYGQSATSSRHSHLESGT